MSVLWGFHLLLAPRNEQWLRSCSCEAKKCCGLKVIGQFYTWHSVYSFWRHSQIVKTVIYYPLSFWRSSSLRKWPRWCHAHVIWAFSAWVWSLLIHDRKYGAVIEAKSFPNVNRALCKRFLIHTWAGMRLERLDWEQGWLVRGQALLVRANCHELRWKILKKYCGVLYSEILLHTCCRSNNAAGGLR